MRVDDSLGRWLHGVSVPVAWRARSIAIAHHRQAQPFDRIDRAAVPDASETLEHEEFRLVIDEEIARLPARYRTVIVLCCLEGLSDDVAARRLRCPIGTVHSRLHRARERLRGRLKSRGLNPAICTLTAISGGLSSRAAVARGLVSSTAAAAGVWRPAKRPRGLPRPPHLALADSAHRSMFMIRGICVAASALVVLGLAAPGFGRQGVAGPGPGAKDRHVEESEWRFIES